MLMFAETDEICKHAPRVPISSIKVEVKKKHISTGCDFSCFSAHWMEQDLF
jgi:hypothetical protein